MKDHKATARERFEELLDRHVNGEDTRKQLLADIMPLIDELQVEIRRETLGEAKEAVRKCISPDREDAPNKLREARLIYRIEAMDAIEALRSPDTSPKT